MTQEDFKALPLLMKPGQACEVLGCQPRTLRGLREAYRGLAVRLEGMKQWRYRKVVVGRIAGLN